MKSARKKKRCFFALRGCQNGGNVVKPTALVIFGTVGFDQNDAYEIPMRIAPFPFFFDRKNHAFFPLQLLFSSHLPPRCWWLWVPTKQCQAIIQRLLSTSFSVGKSQGEWFRMGKIPEILCRNQKVSQHVISNIPHKTTLPGTLQLWKWGGKSSYYSQTQYYRQGWLQTSRGEGAKKTHCGAEKNAYFFGPEKKRFDWFRIGISW